MDLTNNLLLNTYSIIILFIIYLLFRKNNEMKLVRYNIYISMVTTTILMLFLDILSRFDGKPNTIYPIINHTANFLVFNFYLILPSLWLAYVYNHIDEDERKTIKLLFFLLFLNIINVIMVAISIPYGWFYFIDSNNIYHRGPFYLQLTLSTISLLILGLGMIIINRDKIERKYYPSLIFFIIPPIVSIYFQFVFYGISITLNCVTLSLLIIFLNIQTQNLYTDFLTRVNNRKKLDEYLKKKICSSTEQRTFSAIMIDLNSFKEINDSFGHNIGDSALQKTAELLSKCLRFEDKIFRFGGDEFCIVLDIFNMKELETIIYRINKSFEEFNEISDFPYKLSFSMGYAIYDYNSRMNSEEFLKQIDILMYKNKISIRNLIAN